VITMKMIGKIRRMYLRSKVMYLLCLLDLPGSGTRKSSTLTSSILLSLM
jgi:hypothetical protein